MNYLIYHPNRIVTEINGLKIYHDSFGHNEDPYLWNKQFLHSFCHITQISPQINSKIFWVSGDTYPNFNKLICDCVFIVQDKILWENTNNISVSDAIIDNKQAFEHHYKWVNPPYYEHLFRKRKRYTLKADSDKSFQAQDKNQNLIDIIPFLNNEGISLDALKSKISFTQSGKKSINSTPYKLSHDIAEKLYVHLSKSDIIIKGEMIENMHPMNNE